MSVIAPDGIAILRGAPHLAQAEIFLEFVLSEAGQSLWMIPRGQPKGPKRFDLARMGVLPRLYRGALAQSMIPLNPFETHSAFRYDSAKGSRRWAFLNDLLGQTVLDVHPSLKTAWTAALSCPGQTREALIRELSQPFLSEAEAEKMATRWQKDRLWAGRMANEWTRQARARFESVRERAKGLASERIPQSR